MSNVIVQEQLKGVVGAMLPSKANEGSQAYVRLGRYGEVVVTGDKVRGACAEGSFFVNSNATIGTGVKLQGDTTTAWVATTPSILIVNGDVVGGKNIEMDYIKLFMTAAGAGLASLMVNALVDNKDRYASGGTAITGYTTNSNSGASPSSIARLYYGATASAASGSVRKVGRAVLRGAIPVVNDVYTLHFGGDSIASAGTDGTTTIMSKVVGMAPVVVAPGHSLLVYLWAGSMSTSPSCEYEIGWVER